MAWIGTATGKAFYEALDVTKLDFAAVMKTVDGVPAKDNGTSTFTVTVGGMVAGEHADKHLTFATSLNQYLVVTNTADTVQVVGDASGEASGDQVSIGPFKVNEHQKKLCSFHGGDPELEYLVTENNQIQLWIRHDASAETADLVHVEDLDTVIYARQLAIDELLLLRTWARKDFGARE